MDRRLMLSGKETEDESVRAWEKIADFEIETATDKKQPLTLSGLPGYTEFHIEITHLYNEHESTVSSLICSVNGAEIMRFNCNKKPVDADVTKFAQRGELTYNGLYWLAHQMSVSMNRSGYLSTTGMPVEPYHVTFGEPATEIKFFNNVWPMQCGHIEVWAR